MKNIGIFASVDPLTLDKTLLDKFENQKNIEKKKFIERIDKYDLDEFDKEIIDFWYY